MRYILAAVGVFHLLCGFNVLAFEGNVENTFQPRGILSELRAKIALTNNAANKVEEVQTSEGIEGLLKYFVYTRENPVQPEVVEADVESVIRNVFNPLNPTTISIHRWNGDRNSEENGIIVSTKLEQENCNIIVVDWNALVGETYAEGAANVPAVGEAIADFIILLHQHFSVKLEQVHLVGFSLGAQVAGFTGQWIYKKLGVKVQRITGLDPAGAIFSDASDDDEHLSADDADFVEVIHTSIIGYEQPCGHADYYPNGGKSQPECSDDDASCSHQRAYQLVREMWSNERNEFVSTKCESLEGMSLATCNWVNVKMGETLLKTGLYYLETNGGYPYSKGSYVYSFF